MKDELGIVEMTYDVTYVMEKLEYVGYDTSTVDEFTLYNELVNINYDNFVLDNYALESLWTTMGIDWTTFDQTLYAEVKEELGIIDMPYDVNYILEILWRVGYDASTVDAHYMWSILAEEDYTDFVLDRTLLEGFWEQNGVDMEQFDFTIYDEILDYELEIPYLPYDVHYIQGLLTRLEVDYSTLSETEMEEYLLAIDYETTVLDVTLLENFFEYFGIDSTLFD